MGIRLTPSVVMIFFLATLFFLIQQRKTISLSLLAANVQDKQQKNSSALIDDYGNFCVFMLVTYNKLENKQSLE